MRAYHITSKKNMPCIMEEGLVPYLGFLSDMVIEAFPAVFMFKELSEVDYAMKHWFGDFIRYVYPLEDLTLLQVDLPEDFEVRERHDWELVSYHRIPPCYISEIGFSELYKDNKEDKNMSKTIKTEAYKMYGQLDEQAKKKDMDAFVFVNGRVVPASQVKDKPKSGVHTAPEKQFA